MCKCPFQGSILATTVSNISKVASSQLSTVSLHGNTTTGKDKIPINTHGWCIAAHHGTGH